MDRTVISPLRQPERQTTPQPRLAGQATMFPVDTTYGPLTVNIAISLHRTPRQKCSACGNRRVCFSVGLGDAIKSPPMCAKCAGIR